jgi:hypothetical protein
VIYNAGLLKESWISGNMIWLLLSIFFYELIKGLIDFDYGFAFLNP